MMMTVRRLKTYTAQTGLVYQYYFVGKRPALPNEPAAPATEFVFDVSSDRRTTYSVSVFLQVDVVQAWETANRELSDAERYGLVKVRLFRAFDELGDVFKDGRRLLIDQNALRDAVELLQIG